MKIEANLVPEEVKMMYGVSLLPNMKEQTFKDCKEHRKCLLCNLLMHKKMIFLKLVETFKNLNS